MIDFSKMDLMEMRTLQAQLNRAIEEKYTEKQRKSWEALKVAYQDYVGEFEDIILTLSDSDGCDYEVDLGTCLIFSDLGRLDGRNLY